MDHDYITDRMNYFLDRAKTVLVERLNYVLPKISENWWEICVIDNLNAEQQKEIQNGTSHNLESFDLLILLRIADKSWYAISEAGKIPVEEEKQEHFH